MVENRLEKGSSILDSPTAASVPWTALSVPSRNLGALPLPVVPFEQEYTPKDQSEAPILFSTFSTYCAGFVLRSRPTADM